MADRPLRLTCPVCGEPVDVPFTASFVADERPALLEALASGRLNAAACPVCGHEGLVPEPVVIRLPASDRVIGYMPVEVPHNRKALLARRLTKRLAASAAPPRSVKICFGLSQLRSELRNIPGGGDAPEYRRRFDDAGSPRHRQVALARALRDRPLDPALLTRLGIAFYESGKLSQARKALETALEQGPDQVDALRCLGSVSLDEGRPEDALRLYDRVVSRTHDARSRFLAGVAAFKAGRARAALERLRQATQDEPSLIEGYLWQAVAYDALGDKAAALAALWLAARNGLRDPNRVLSLSELGALRKERGFVSFMHFLKRLHDRDERKAGRSDRRSRHRRKRRNARPPRPRGGR